MATKKRFSKQQGDQKPPSGGLGVAVEVIETRPDDQGNIVVNNVQIRLQTVDRTSKDIGAFIIALQAAEAVSYANRTDLYDIYKHLELDGHLMGIIEKRIASVLNKALYFEKGETQVDEMDDFIRSDVFRKVIKEIMWQKMWGVSGMEFIPGETVAFNNIPRKHINPKLGIISKDQWGQEGLPYDKVWNLWVLGTWDDLGLLCCCAPYAIWKKGTFADYAQYIEIFGQPVIITKYDAHDAKTKVELDEVMRNAGGSIRLQIPKQAEFEMLDGKNSNANGDLQSKFIDACNKEMSKIILGATETTDSSSSSGHAQSQVHSTQQDETIKSDMADVLNALNAPHFIAILKSYGLPVEDGNFCYKDEVDVQEQTAMLNMDKTLSTLVPMDDDYFYETYNRPKPADYAAQKAQKEAERVAAIPVAPGAPPPKAAAKKSAQKVPSKAKLSDETEEEQQTWWNRFRTTLADFFDPAQ